MGAEKFGSGGEDVGGSENTEWDAVAQMAESGAEEKSLPAEQIAEAATIMLDLGEESELAGQSAVFKYYQEHDVKMSMPEFLNDVRRYGGVKYAEGLAPEAKFYFSTSLDHALDFLRAREITSAVKHDDEQMDVNDKTKLLPSLLHLSADTLGEDGELKSGIDAERGQISDEVVFVVKQDIVKSNYFVKAGKYPAMKYLWMGMEGLGIVSQSPEAKEKLQEISGTTPVYTREEWDNMDTSAENLAEIAKENLRKSIERNEAERKQRMEALRQRVFEKVDLEEVEKLTGSYAEKAEAQRLSEVYAAMAEDYQLGAEKMIDYMTEVLELAERPDIIYRGGMDGGIRGECQRRAGGDLIRVNAEYANRYNIGEQIETIAHECWHSYQHMVLDTAEGTVWADRRELYNYNLQNYVTDDVDQEAYRKQLIEEEAWSFGAKIREKVRGFEPDEEELKRQVFTNVDTTEMMRTVGMQLRNFSVEALLKATGVDSFEDLKNYDGEKFAEIAGPLAEYLMNVAGVSVPIKVDVEDWLRGDKYVEYSIVQKSMKLSKAEMKKIDFVDNLINVGIWAWRMHEKDVVKNGQYSERGRLYAYNMDHALPVDWGTGEGTSQLVVAEATVFANVVATNVRSRMKPTAESSVGTGEGAMEMPTEQVSEPHVAKGWMSRAREKVTKWWKGEK